MKKLALIYGMVLTSLFPSVLTHASENVSIVDVQGDYVSLHDLIVALDGDVTVDSEDETKYTFSAQEKEVYISQGWGYSLVNGQSEPLMIESSSVDESVDIMVWKTPILFDEEIFVPISYVERIFDLEYKEGSFEQDGDIVVDGEDLAPSEPVVPEVKPDEDVDVPQVSPETPSVGENKPEVKPDVVVGILLNKTSVSLEVGSSDKVNAAVNPFDVSDTSVTWTSSNDGVATVDSRGNIQAVGVGEATLTVKSNLTPSVSATVKVTVKAKPVEEVKPTPTPDPVPTPTPEPTPTPDPVPTPDPEPSKSHLDPYAVVDRAVNELGFCRASTSAFTNWMGCDGTWAENEVSVGVTSGNGLNVAIMYFDDTSTSNFYQILRFALPSAQYLIDKLNDSSFWGGELTIDGHKVLVETPDYGVSVTIYQ